MSTTLPLQTDITTDLHPNQSQQLENRELDASKLCDIAEEARNQGDFAKAWSLYNEAQQIIPGYVRALFSMSGLCWRDGNQALAVSLLEQVINKKPDYAEAYELLGKFYSDLGDTNKCLEMYDRAIRLKPTIFYAYLWKAEKMLELGYPEQCLLDVNRALEVSPHHPHVLQLKETALGRWIMMSKAKKSHGLEMKCDPKDFYVSVKKGNVLLDEIKEAITFLETAHYLVYHGILDGHTFTLGRLRESLNQIELELAHVKERLPKRFTSDSSDNYQSPRVDAEDERLPASQNVSQIGVSKTWQEPSKYLPENLPESEHYGKSEAYNINGNIVPSKEVRVAASKTLYGFCKSSTNNNAKICATNDQRTPLIPSKAVQAEASKTLYGFSKSPSEVNASSKNHRDFASENKSFKSQPQQEPQTDHESSLVTNSKINNCTKTSQSAFNKNAFSQLFLKPEYRDILRQLKASGQKFTDPEFPPNLRSLTGGISQDELTAMGHSVNYGSLIWRRAEEIYGKDNFEVFSQSIGPEDIVQGALGDCYFLSTLAVLSDSPDRIRRLFGCQDPNNQGCYGVRICNRGSWEVVVVDDYLPCSPINNKPCFAQGNGNEIWVALLEKAWAKVYGSYAGIDAGFTIQVLYAFTGAPTQYYLTNDPSNHEMIWKQIKVGEMKNFLMTCGSEDSTGDAELFTAVGLVPGHAYSLSAAVEVCDREGQLVRLVKLRNPWGKGEWTGDWSDESPTWTCELMRQLDVEERDDGIFYMSFKDMLKYFSDVQICKVHDNFSHKALRVICDSKHAIYFKVTIRAPGHYYIGINQENQKKSTQDYNYSDARIVLGKKTNNGYEYIDECQKPDKVVWADGHLDSGEYIGYSKVTWNDKGNGTNCITITSYGPSEVELEQIPKAYCSSFFDKIYLSKGRQSKILANYEHCGVPNCYRAVDIDNDEFGFIYYRNESNLTLEEEVSFEALEGLKLRKPYRGNNFKIMVPPGQEKVVLTKTKILPKAAGTKQTFTDKAQFF